MKDFPIITTHLPSLEEINKSAEEMRIAEEKAEEERREQQRIEERKKILEGRFALYGEHFKHIVDELNKIEPEIKAFVSDDCRLMIGKWDAVLELKAEYTQVSVFRSKPTGKSSFIVGYYPETKRFPQRKDGTYNYESIAYHLLMLHKQWLSRREKENALGTTYWLAEKFNKDNNLSFWGEFKAESNEYEANKIKINYSPRLSVGDAQRLHDLLVEHGFIVKK